MTSGTDNRNPAQSFPPSQWIRLIIVYLCIPLILMICAWDFGWWQAWVFGLLIFIAGVGGTTMPRAHG